MYNKAQPLKFIKLSVLLLGLIFIIWLILHLIGLSQFRVIGTDPNINKVSNAIPYFNIEFNKQLVKTGVEVSSTPNVIKNYTVKGKTLYITLNLLKANETYTIDIKHIEDLSGATINNKTLAFTAQYISPADLPKAQQKSILNNQDNYSSVANNPITADLPYSTLSYTLSSVVEKNSAGNYQLVVDAQIFLSEADMSNESAAIDQYKQDILNYITSLGLNPSNYDIQYSITTP